MVRLGLVGGAVVFFYLLLIVRCIYERLWLSIVLTALMVSVLRSFYPGLVASVVGDLRMFELFLSLAATVVSFWLVTLALKKSASATSSE